MDREIGDGHFSREDESRDAGEEAITRRMPPTSSRIPEKPIKLETSNGRTSVTAES